MPPFHQLELSDRWRTIPGGPCPPIFHFHLALLHSVSMGRFARNRGPKHCLQSAALKGTASSSLANHLSQCSVGTTDFVSSPCSSKGSRTLLKLSHGLIKTAFRESSCGWRNHMHRSTCTEAPHPTGMGQSMWILSRAS